MPTNRSRRTLNALPEDVFTEPFISTLAPFVKNRKLGECANRWGSTVPKQYVPMSFKASKSAKCSPQVSGKC